MKVHELIEHLLELDQNLECCIEIEDDEIEPVKHAQSRRVSRVRRSIAFEYDADSDLSAVVIS